LSFDDGSLGLAVFWKSNPLIEICESVFSSLFPSQLILTETLVQFSTLFYDLLLNVKSQRIDQVVDDLIIDLRKLKTTLSIIGIIPISPNLRQTAVFPLKQLSLNSPAYPKSRQTIKVLVNLKVELLGL
jgi:hypothetical protein